MPTRSWYLSKYLAGYNADVQQLQDGADEGWFRNTLMRCVRRFNQVSEQTSASTSAIEAEHFGRYHDDGDNDAESSISFTCSNVATDGFSSGSSNDVYDDSSDSCGHEDVTRGDFSEDDSDTSYADSCIIWPLVSWGPEYSDAIGFPAARQPFLAQSADAVAMRPLVQWSEDLPYHRMTCGSEESAFASSADGKLTCSGDNA